MEPKAIKKKSPCSGLAGSGSAFGSYRKSNADDSLSDSGNPRPPTHTLESLWLLYQECLLPKCDSGQGGAQEGLASLVQSSLPSVWFPGVHIQLGDQPGHKLWLGAAPRGDVTGTLASGRGLPGKIPSGLPLWNGVSLPRAVSAPKLM